MSCMCGDLGCASCGPAQGANLQAEAAFDAVYEDLLKFFKSHEYGADIRMELADWIAGREQAAYNRGVSDSLRELDAGASFINPAAYDYEEE